MSEEVIQGNDGHTTGGASWTVLVYMVADNDLEEYAVLDLKEMIAVGGNEAFKFVVQVDRAQAYSSESVPGIGNWTSAKRILIDSTGAHEIADLGEVNMADPIVLADFIAWSTQTFPADRTMLDLWNHGAGWTGFGVDESIQSHPILSVAQLKQGISRGLQTAGLKRFDIIGFDACLMASYEVARTLSPFGEYLLASEELEPGHGWDYRAFARLREEPTRMPVDVAADVIGGFFAQASVERSGSELTLSLVDLTRIDELEQAFGKFAGSLALVQPSQVGSIGQARGLAQRFGSAPDPEYDANLVDIGSFSRGVQTRSDVADADAEQLRVAIESVVVLNRTAQGTQNASGLSIYFPPFSTLYNAEYDRLPEVAAWRGFLAAYYGGGSSIANALNLPDSGTLGWTDSAAVLDVAVSPSTLANIVETAAYGGIVDETASFAQAYSTFPADLLPGGLRASWYGEAAVISQGGSTTIGFLDFYDDATTGESFVDVPFFYTSPTGDVSYVVRSDVLLEDGSPAGQEIWFEYTDTVVGELVVEPGGMLTPLSLFITDAGVEWQEAEMTLDPMQAVTFTIESLFGVMEPGSIVYLELSAWDYGGNVDSVGGSLEVPGGAVGCGAVTEAGQCEGNVVVYCEEGKVLSEDCSSQDGFACGLDEESGLFMCLQVGCGDITDVGVCDGDVLYYCDADQVYYVDCAEEGYFCGYDSQEGYYNCLQ